MTVIATKNGVRGRFSDAVWNSGVPQKNGWVPLSSSDEKKTLPKEIVDMATQRKAKAADAEKSNTTEAVPGTGSDQPKTQIPEKAEDIPGTVDELRALLDSMGVKYPPNYKVNGLTNLVKKHLNME